MIARHPRCIDGRHASRRGASLLPMLVVLILLAILSLAVSRVGRGDFRRARDARGAIEAREGAELVALSVQRDFATYGAGSLPLGGRLPDVVWSNAHARAIARSMRTSPTTYWTVADGESGDSASGTLARATIHTGWRLAVPDIDINAALTVRDSATLAGAALVVGRDTTLAAWGACSDSSLFPTTGAAVALPDTLRLCDGGCGAARGGTRTVGTPALLSDAGAVGVARFSNFGDEDWTSLTAHAAVALPPGSIVTPGPSLAGGTCDRGAASNWGDPFGAVAPCASYLPIIWARGDVELRGGRGQGLLLADGDVTLSAGAVFAGVIVARDDVIASGSGATILGAVLAGDSRSGSGDFTSLDGATLVQSSPCAVARALLGGARLLRIRERGWAALR